MSVRPFSFMSSTLTRTRAGIVWGLMCWCSTASAALVVEGKPIWGWDGTIHLEQFNLLTLQIRNTSDVPWQGNLELATVAGLSGGDIPLLQPDLYLEGLGQRRLQFLIFLPATTDYRLRWGGRADESVVIDAPSVSDRPATIEILSRSALSRPFSRFTPFPEADFPYSAAGLETLGSVILSHVPEWTNAQQQAFRDWLWAGGELTLVPDRAGTPLNFSGVLTALNEPSSQFAAGGGTVRRSERSSFISRSEGEETESPYRYSEWDSTRSILAALRDLTQPEHHWPLIYTLSVLYLLALFPGCWLIGRRRGNAFMVYGLVLAVVGLFSFGFRSVGARGYGEETAVYSVAVTRAADDGRALATLWSNLFVTRGAQYLVEHDWEGATYSSGQGTDAVRGRVLNRPQGKMGVDIPAFSSRTFVATGVISGELPPPVLSNVMRRTNGDGIETLQELNLEFPDDRLWRDDPLFRGLVVAGDRTYSLLPSGNRLLLESSSQSLGESFEPGTWQSLRFDFFRNEVVTRDETFRLLFWPLVASDLGLYSNAMAEEFKFPENRAAVYLYCELPRSFDIAGGEFPQQGGRLLRAYWMHLGDVPDAEQNANEIPAPDADPP